MFIPTLFTIIGILIIAIQPNESSSLIIIAGLLCYTVGYLAEISGELKNLSRKLKEKENENK